MKVTLLSQSNIIMSRKRAVHKAGLGNVFSLTVKEQELVEEAKRYRLDIVGISATKRHGSGIVQMGDGWRLFYFGVHPIVSAQVGVGILTSAQVKDRVL